MSECGLSVVIVNYNTGALLRRCLESLQPQLGAATEVIVVDNASSDRSADGVEELFPEVRLIRNRANLGFARATNQGLALAAGRYALLLNPDVTLEPDALSAALGYMDANPGVGILGPRILRPDGRLDPPARRSFKTPATYLYKMLGLSHLFPRHRRFGRYYLSYLDEKATTDVDSVVGAFLLVRREVMERVGLLDDRFFMYCEDEDWCWRAKQAGWRVVYHPAAVVHHRRGSSTAKHPFRMAYHRHRSYFLYHRKNIAPRYLRIVNAAVYMGIGLGMGAAIGMAAAARLLSPARNGMSARPRSRPTLPAGTAGYEAAKRLLDIGVASAALALLSPLWLLIGLVIRATSPGPALFRATVIGKDGQPFPYYKFRSMIAGDDRHHKEWLRDFVTRDAPYRKRTFKVDADPRVTPVGRILRRLSLDEVPQLINVLRGEMSIVGPRPPIPFEYTLYDQRAKQRLAVKPGITGLYQVTARSQVPFSRMLALDLEYIERRSLELDLKIMLRTVGVMVAGRGAG